MFVINSQHSEARLCKVDGCVQDLRAEKPYYLRYRVCKYHLMALQLLIDGHLQRFCQQCAKFQPLEDFEGSKRSCRKSLATHCTRRRLMRSVMRQQRDEAALPTCTFPPTASVSAQLLDSAFMGGDSSIIPSKEDNADATYAATMSMVQELPQPQTPPSIWPASALRPVACITSHLAAPGVVVYAPGGQTPEYREAMLSGGPFEEGPSSGPKRQRVTMRLAPPSVAAMWPSATSSCTTCTAVTGGDVPPPISQAAVAAVRIQDSNFFESQAPGCPPGATPPPVGATLPLQSEGAGGCGNRTFNSSWWHEDRHQRRPPPLSSRNPVLQQRPPHAITQATAQHPAASQQLSSDTSSPGVPLEKEAWLNPFCVQPSTIQVQTTSLLATPPPSSSSALVPSTQLVRPPPIFYRQPPAAVSSGLVSGGPIGQNFNLVHGSIAQTLPQQQRSEDGRQDVLGEDLSGTITAVKKSAAAACPPPIGAGQRLREQVALSLKGNVW